MCTDKQTRATESCLDYYGYNTCISFLPHVSSQELTENLLLLLWCSLSLTSPDFEHEQSFQCINYHYQHFVSELEVHI